MSEFHVSVLLEEVINQLRVRKDQKYIDATLGGGGHAFEILHLGGRVLSLDVDQEAIGYVQSKIKNGANLRLVRGNFKDIQRIAHSQGFDKVSGILFDLGVSSHQLDTANRGFSFAKEASLDMRMDRSLQVKAADLVNALGQRELEELFKKLGEEHFAKRISKEIVAFRKIKAVATTLELAEIVKRAYPVADSKTHPATRVFQALRIAVNDELNNLKIALSQALDLLDEKGRLVVISFHSLEDRIVKEYFLDFEKRNKGIAVTNKPIVPKEEELTRNPKSRSAKLRVFEKKSL